jgi:Sulfotransferase domain
MNHLPDFLVIGSQKAGTTSLYHVLSRHPQIFMPRKKELHLYKRRMGQYRRYFRDVPDDCRAVGEATPIYICHPRVPALIRRHMPEAKLILTVRNPVERAYSQYWDQRRHMVEWLEFDEVVRIALEDEYRPGHRGYFSRGFYMRYLRRYLELFPREQVLLVFFEDLIESPESVYRQVFRFIGVDDTFQCHEMREPFNPSTVWDNALYRYFFEKPRRLGLLPPPVRRSLCFGPRRRYRYPPMPAGARERLVSFYAGANQELAEFAGRNLAAWSH